MAAAALQKKLVWKHQVHLSYALNLEMDGEEAVQW
jgi:hypothetical protein